MFLTNFQPQYVLKILANPNLNVLIKKCSYKQTCTVESLYNGHLRTDLPGRCREVAVMERLSIRGFE